MSLSRLSPYFIIINLLTTPTTSLSHTLNKTASILKSPKSILTKHSPKSRVDSRAGLMSTPAQSSLSNRSITPPRRSRTPTSPTTKSPNSPTSFKIRSFNVLAGSTYISQDLMNQIFSSGLESSPYPELVLVTISGWSSSFKISADVCLDEWFEPGASFPGYRLLLHSFSGSAVHYLYAHQPQPNSEKTKISVVEKARAENLSSKTDIYNNSMVTISNPGLWSFDLNLISLNSALNPLSAEPFEEVQKMLRKTFSEIGRAHLSIVQGFMNPMAIDPFVYGGTVEPLGAFLAPSILFEKSIDPLRISARFGDSFNLKNWLRETDLVYKALEKGLFGLEEGELGEVSFHYSKPNSGVVQMWAPLRSLLGGPLVALQAVKMGEFEFSALGAEMLPMVVNDFEVCLSSLIHKEEVKYKLNELQINFEGIEVERLLRNQKKLLKIAVWFVVDGKEHEIGSLVVSEQGRYEISLVGFQIKVREGVSPVVRVVLREKLKVRRKGMARLSGSKESLEGDLVGSGEFMFKQSSKKRKLGCWEHLREGWKVPGNF